MKNRIFLALISICAALCLCIGCDTNRNVGKNPDATGLLGEENAAVMPGEKGPLLPPEYIADEFPNKIVYSTKHDVDIAALREDCRIRGGAFNECGSPCADGAICIKMCAFTCEFR